MNRLVLHIRRKSREQWQREAVGFFDQMRAWIQGNGELSALIAFVVGIAIVLEFRIFFMAVLLLAFLAFLVWQIALPEERASSSKNGS